MAAKENCVCLHLDVGRVNNEGVCSRGASQLGTSRFLLLYLLLPLVLEKYERKRRKIEFVERIPKLNLRCRKNIK